MSVESETLSELMQSNLEANPVWQKAMESGSFGARTR